jgi:hypothetical protein
MIWVLNKQMRRSSKNKIPYILSSFFAKIPSQEFNYLNVNSKQLSNFHAIAKIRNVYFTYLGKIISIQNLIEVFFEED